MEDFAIFYTGAIQKVYLSELDYYDDRQGPLKCGFALYRKNALRIPIAKAAALDLFLKKIGLELEYDVYRATIEKNYVFQPANF